MPCVSLYFPQYLAESSLIIITVIAHLTVNLYSLQSTSVLRISFGLFMSSEREGEQKGRGYSPHFTSEDVEA